MPVVPCHLCVGASAARNAARWPECLSDRMFPTFAATTWHEQARSEYIPGLGPLPNQRLLGTHARMHSLTHPLTHSGALTHSLTHARTHALTHSSPTRMRARTLVCAHVLPNWSVCLRSQSSCRCCSTARCGSTRTWAGPLPPAFISTAHVPRRCLSLRCADGSAPLAALRQYILQARPTDVASVYDGRRG